MIPFEDKTDVADGLPDASNFPRAAAGLVERGGREVQGDVGFKAVELADRSPKSIEEVPVRNRGLADDLRCDLVLEEPGLQLVMEIKLVLVGQARSIIRLVERRLGAQTFQIRHGIFEFDARREVALHRRLRPAVLVDDLRNDDVPDIYRSLVLLNRLDDPLRVDVDRPVHPLERVIDENGAADLFRWHLDRRDRLRAPRDAEHGLEAGEARMRSLPPLAFRTRDRSLDTGDPSPQPGDPVRSAYDAGAD